MSDSSFDVEVSSEVGEGECRDVSEVQRRSLAARQEEPLYLQQQECFERVRARGGRSGSSAKGSGRKQDPVSEDGQTIECPDCGNASHFQDYCSVPKEETVPVPEGRSKVSDDQIAPSRKTGSSGSRSEPSTQPLPLHSGKRAVSPNLEGATKSAGAGAPPQVDSTAVTPNTTSETRGYVPIYRPLFQR